MTNLPQINSFSELCSVQIAPGSVEFVGFDELLSQVTAIRDGLSTVVVTPDTVQANKKLVASLRKAFNELDTYRKTAKKEYLEQFSVFEAQVKQIGQITTEAETHIREQIKELEEQEINIKDQEMREIFDLRLSKFDLDGIVDYSDFATQNQQIFNKSFSMNKVKTLIGEWLDRINTEVTALKVLAEQNGQYIPKILRSYKHNHFNFASTVIEIDQEEKEIQELEQSIQDETDDTEEFVEAEIDENDADTFAVLYIKYSDWDRVVELLEQNNIYYQT